MEKHLCQCCGAPLEKYENYYECPYCGSRFEDDFEEKAAVRLVDVLNEAKLESLSNAKRVLYNTAHANNISNQAVSDAAFKVLAIDPDDLLANFYVASIDEDPSLLNHWLAQAPISPSVAEEVVTFELRGMDPRNVFALKDYAERQFKGDKQLRIVSQIEDEAQRLSEGFYNPAFPRDVFLCYSSKDQFRVMEICDLLEENGFTVFAAYRNLRHGKGAAENYLTALHQAMNNCKVVVFLSSKNSRSASCDALKVELPYINANCPKMGRVEFIVEPYDEGRPLPILVKQLLKETFEGLEWCRTEEDLIRRVFQYTSKHNVICPRCGHENEPDARFCHKCGEPLSEDAKAAMRQNNQSTPSGAKPSFTERMKSIVASGVEAVKKAAANAAAQSSSNRSEQVKPDPKPKPKPQSKPASAKPAKPAQNSKKPASTVPGGGAGRVLSLLDAIFALIYLVFGMAMSMGDMVTVYGSTTTYCNLFAAIRYIPNLALALGLIIAMLVFDIILFRMAIKKTTKFKKGMVLCIIGAIFGYITFGILIGDWSAYSNGTNFASTGMLAAMAAMPFISGWILMLGAVIYGVRGIARRSKRKSEQS